MSEYHFSEIEKKWQEYWSENQTYKVDDDSDKEKFYCLAQFPYPSGAGLHMGHVSIYTYTDVIARFKVHQGYEVLHPMGWDAFGLPTENHAIKEGVHPAVITKKNVDNFKKQLNSCGFSYDWNREINTSSPDYFKWTQWIWKRLHSAGLTYKTNMPVNWCDHCKIVVANEEVDANGLHERCGNNTRQKNMNQWMFKITAYAQKLLDGLEEVDWPESSKKAQRDWIGKSIGAEVRFKISGHEESLEVFTTRPDTLFGATYMVVAPEHPLLDNIVTSQCKENVVEYKKQASFKSQFDRAEMNTEKTGVFTGAYAINPMNGKEIPIWTADYVLISYGTGAIMAVPAHDTRDFEFAQTFSLPIIRVLQEKDSKDQEELNEAFTGNGLLVNSANEELDINGLEKNEAIMKVCEWLENKDYGKKAVNFKLRDWIFARQRYWGEPFPLYYTEDDEMELVEDDQLPLKLPDVESYEPTDNGESPLSAIDSWVNIKANDGKPAKRETDTMPQWAGSCWYYLRFMDPQNEETFASLDRQKRWGSVDVYVGGTEHLNLHDLYSRFWHKALYDQGIVSEPEPFKKILHQGMILGEDGTKMSKSLGNVVNPDEVIKIYGADVVRMNLCFMGPVETSKPWSESGLEASKKFLNRLYRTIAQEDKWVEGNGSDSILKPLHKTIKVVTQDYERYSFNTAIARLMELLNALQKEKALGKASLSKVVIMLAPIAPHFSEEIWQKLGNEGSVTKAPFPIYEEKHTVENACEIVVQVLGKVKARVEVPVGLNPKEQESLVLEMDDVKKLLEGSDLIKTISVPGRLVNFVIKK
jgi:leucyl-tRNA synthetase